PSIAEMVEIANDRCAYWKFIARAIDRLVENRDAYTKAIEKLEQPPPKIVSKTEVQRIINDAAKSIVPCEQEYRPTPREHLLLPDRGSTGTLDEARLFESHERGLKEAGARR